MKKLTFALFALVLIASTVSAQTGKLETITPTGGLSLVSSATTNYTVPTSTWATPFSIHWYSSAASRNDTTQLKIYQSLNNVTWEQVGSTQTLVPSDNSDLITDTLYARYIKIQVIAGNTDSLGKVYIHYWHQ